MRESIDETVAKIVAEQFELPLEKVTMNSQFMDDFKEDSLSMVELVLAIEDVLAWRFQMTIPKRSKLSATSSTISRCTPSGPGHERAPLSTANP